MTKAIEGGSMLISSQQHMKTRHPSSMGDLLRPALVFTQPK